MMYSEDIVQYGSEGSELILVPIILELRELRVHEVHLIIVRVSVQFVSFVCFSVICVCWSVLSHSQTSLTALCHLERGWLHPLLICYKGTNALT